MDLNVAHVSKISTELGKDQRNVAAVVALLDEGATVPFLARYRKEVSGNMDEVAITAVRDRVEELRAMDARREAILKSLEERKLLTEELKKKIEEAETLTKLEDIYLPFRPKRRTRAIIAREKGLEPLAQLLLAQGADDPFAAAKAYINAEKGVASEDEALAGARDIIAEQASEDAVARAAMRQLYFDKGIFISKVIEGKENDGAKFKDYFDWKEPVSKTPSHRLLAMRRGEKEEFLTLRVEVPEDEAIAILERIFVKGGGLCSAQVKEALADGFKRLLSLSMETETRLETKKKADIEAIGVFATNLREILMASPLGHKNVLALDPGFRTGCKTVCLDSNGKLLHHDVIFPHQSEGQIERSAQLVMALCQKFKVEVIAIGNGTAGRETEEFVRGLKLPGVTVVMVNESGASVYSASEAARDEFPNEDVTVRGAVSIGRRLMDPLAELVKIDPKSIGVGQYQHDVDQTALKKSLDDVVVSCVNNVGVDVNTASKELLSYVSGLGSVLAKNIVEYRNQNGSFKTRSELKKVTRLGPKAFEQAAGFLRIPDGKNPLDASAVHPERYSLVEQMAKDIGCHVADLLKDASTRTKIDISKYVTDEVGLPTLKDIMNELSKPGRDPRQKFEAFQFAEISKIEDVQPGMKVPGIVTNVTNFGAFVDIGVHQDGLVHISELSDNYVTDPASVVKTQQRVMVTVLDVDLPRRRIALSMKSNPVIGTRESRNAARAERPHDGGRRDGGRPQGGGPRRDAPQPVNNAMAEAFKAMLAGKKR